MKKVTSIRAENLKLPATKLELEDDLTILCGGNATGKSAVADAYALAMTGAHPDLGKTNPAIMQLACGASMHVEAIFSDGSRNAKSWSRSKSGAVKKAELGELTLNSASFDERLFIAANEKTRVEMIADASGSGAIPPIGGIRANVTDLLGDLAGEVELPDAGTDFFEGAVAIRAALEELRKERKRDKIRMEKTVQGTAALGNAPARPTMDDDKFREMQNELAAARQLAGRESGSPDALREIVAESVPPEEVGAARILRAQIEEEIEEAKTELNDARAKFLAAEHIFRAKSTDPVPQNCDESKLSEAIENLEKVIAEDCGTGTLKAANEDVDKSQGLISRLRFKRDRLEEIMSIAATPSAECPVCGCADEDWAAKATGRAENERANAESALKNAILADKLLRETQTEMTERRLAATEAAKEIEKIGATIREAEANNAARSSAENSRNKAEEVKDAIDSNLMALRDELADQIALIEYSERANRAAEVLAAIENIPTLETLVEHEQGTRAEWAAYNADAKRIEEANGAIESATGDIEKLTTALDAVAKATLEQATTLMAPMIDLANRIGRGVLRGRVVNWGTDIALDRDGTTIPFVTLSGSEKLVIATAIKAALAGREGAPLLIVDEVGRIAPLLQPGFLSNLSDEVAAGRIGRVLAIMPGSADNIRRQWEMLHGMKYDHDFAFVEI